MALSVVNWNVEWATPRSERSPEILRRIRSQDPDIICLTEANDTLLDDLGGYAICSELDHGHRIIKGRRKVMLWSKQPWENIDSLGDDSLPPGRFVSGITGAAGGEITVVGICIPWSGSRTPRYGGNRRQWQDHENYLDVLAALLTRADPRRTVLVGDFNQPIGQRSNVPVRLRAKLRSAIPPGMTIATAGLGHQAKRTIDHIVLGSALTAESLVVISNSHGEKNLSDHFGVVAKLSAEDQQPTPSTDE